MVQFILYVQLKNRQYRRRNMFPVMILPFVKVLKLSVKSICGLVISDMAQMKVACTMVGKSAMA